MKLNNIYNVIQSKWSKLSISLAMLPMILANKVDAYAANAIASNSIKSSDLDFITKQNGNDVFSSVNDVVKSAGSSAYQVVRNIGLTILLVAILVIALGIALNKNPNKRSENKTHLIFYILGAILFFGGATVIVMASKIASQITI